MVDIAREERIEKWDRFLVDFKEFHYSTDNEAVYKGDEILKGDVEMLFSKI